MSDVIRMGGGWGGSSYDRMSPALAARCRQDDIEYERQLREQERERAARAAYAEEQCIRASVAAALERGELVDLREAWANGGVGRTRGEFLAMVSARQDVEDARRKRQAQREIARIGEQTYYEQMSGDTSAHTLESQRREDQEVLHARRRKFAERAAANARRVEARAVAQGVVREHEERQLLKSWGYPA